MAISSVIIEQSTNWYRVLNAPRFDSSRIDTFVAKRPTYAMCDAPIVHGFHHTPTRGIRLAVD